MKSWDTEWPDLYTFWYHLLFVSLLTQGPPRHSHGQVSVVPSVKPPGRIAPMENASHGCYWEQYVQFSKEKKMQYGLSNPVLRQYVKELPACLCSLQHNQQ